MKNILYYACGGGLGHINRIVALSRQLHRQLTKIVPKEQFSQMIFTNTVFPKTVAEIAAREPNFVFHVVPAEFDSHQTKVSFNKVYHELQPSLFVVDTFPRGLGGDLVDLLERTEPSTQSCLNVLVGRTLPKSYTQKFQLGKFVARHFDWVIGTGEPFGVPTENRFEQSQDTASQRRTRFIPCKPWFSRNWDELLERGASARQLNCDLASPIVLVVGCGKSSECNEAESLFLRIRAESQSWNRPFQLRLALPVDFTSNVASEEVVRHWPILELLPAVDLVVGSAGYNLFWETTVTNKRRILLPRERLYDNQFARVNSSSRCSHTKNMFGNLGQAFDPTQIVSQVRHFVEHEDLTLAHSPSKYNNGAEEAAKAIVQQWLAAD